MPDQTDVDPVPDAVQRAATHAFEQIRRLQRAALEACGYPSSEPPPADLGVPWAHGITAEEFAVQIFHQARAAAATSHPVRPGCAYCFHCARATCEHAAPPDAEAVFGGYGNLGLPQWQPLPSALLALEDTRLEGLYEAKPKVLARVVGRKTLIKEQFEAYGRNSLTYRIVGQVIAGFLHVQGRRYALTVQAVETAEHDLVLQVLAPDALLDSLQEAAEAPGTVLGRAHGALRELRIRVMELATSWHNAPNRAARLVVQTSLFGLLKQFASNLERRDRQSRRRTAHASVRATEQRPVAKAVEDVVRAGQDAFYRDRKTQSIIIQGRRGRSHVFNLDGRHVTSLVLPGDLFDRRLKKNRYVPLAPELIAELRAAIANAG